jgi:hypothetical protein
MTKYELIQSIKNEIKETSAILRQNKNNFKHNQKIYSKMGSLADSKDFKKIECYPFSKPWNGTVEINGKKYFNGNFWNYNPDVETAKCHLTCLHIVYNMLRNKKLHCHNEERNEYYVQYHKSYIERTLSSFTEEQDAHVS